MTPDLVMEAGDFIGEAILAHVWMRHELKANPPIFALNHYLPLKCKEGSRDAFYRQFYPGGIMTFYGAHGLTSNGYVGLYPSDDEGNNSEDDFVTANDTCSSGPPSSISDSEDDDPAYGNNIIGAVNFSKFGNNLIGAVDFSNFDNESLPSLVSASSDDSDLESDSSDDNDLEDANYFAYRRSLHVSNTVPCYNI